MLFKSTVTTTALVALSWVAGTAHAASIYPRAHTSMLASISSNCTSTMFSLLSSPASTCLNMRGLVAVITASPTTSLTPSIKTWVGDFCSAGACTEKDLRDTVGLVATGCAAELTAKNITGADLATKVVQYYAPAKKIACLKGSATPVNATTADGVLKLSSKAGITKDYCLPGIMTDIESAFSIQLSRSSFKTLLPQLRPGGNLADTAKAKLKAIFACTQCGQAILAVLKSSDKLIKDGAKRTELGKKMSDAVATCPANIKALSDKPAAGSDAAVAANLLKLQRRNDSAAAQAKSAALVAQSKKASAVSVTAGMNGVMMAFIVCAVALFL